MKKIKKIILNTCIVIMAIGVFVGIIHIISAFTLDKKLQFKTVPVYSSDISSELDGYKIAIITDTHTTNDKRKEEITNYFQQNQIDLIVLGGDYNGEDSTHEVMKWLGALQQTDGIYGVEGNHDNYELVFLTMKENGIIPLDNSGVYIKDHLYLAGVADPWRRIANVSQSVSGAKEEDFVLLMTHNPDVVMEEPMDKVDYAVAGHTHGGQVVFLKLWAPAMDTVSSYGQKFRSGSQTNQDGVPIYVSNGVGDIFVPRVFARPQVIILELHPEKEE